MQRLRRVRINSLRLGALKPGQWRELTQDEVARLLAETAASSGRT